MTTSTALPTQIQHLLEQRAQHSAALTAIEATLARVTVALGGTPATKMAAPTRTMSAAKPAGRRGRPKGGAPGLTANEFVMEFVKAHKNPTTQDITKAWKDAGRNGSADNALSVLSKSGKLKRVALGVGIRGSRFTVA